MLHERKLLSENVHNALLDVELSYKRDPAPKQPNSIYDSTDKFNIIIKGWCRIMQLVYNRIS